MYVVFQFKWIHFIPETEPLTEAKRINKLERNQWSYRRLIFWWSSRFRDNLHSWREPYEAQLEEGLRVESEFSSVNVTKSLNVKKLTHFSFTKWCLCHLRNGLAFRHWKIPEVTRKLRCSSSDGSVLGTNGLLLVRDTIWQKRKTQISWAGCQQMTSQSLAERF